MGQQSQNFSNFELIDAPIGSYEHQVRTAFELKFAEIQSQLDDLRTEYDNTFG